MNRQALYIVTYSNSVYLVYLSVRNSWIVSERLDITV